MIEPELALDALYMVPQTDLEEKFVIWFAFQNHLDRRRRGKRECLKLSCHNDPDDAARNLYQAYRDFCQKFRYVEIPDLYGLEPEKAQQILRQLGLTWQFEGVRHDRRYPVGTVVSQRPSPGTAARVEGVVYLGLNQGDLDRALRRTR